MPPTTNSDSAMDVLSLNLTKTRPKRCNLNAVYSNQWVLRDVIGNVPTIGELRETTDVSTGMVYMYAPGETPKKSCDLFVLDTSNMKIQKLSNRLQYRKRRPSTTANGTDPREKKLRFPMIDFPCLAIMNSGSSKLLAIVGGYICTDESSDGNTNSKLFLVNISDHTQPQWWCQKVEGAAQPRLDATVIVVDNKIYLFGGVDKPHEPPEEPGVQLRSYSILEHDWESHSWKWAASDVPYPIEDVPEEINFGAGVPVFGGDRLLLFPSRQAPSFEGTFTSKNIFYFDTKTSTFKAAKIVTDDMNLPRNLTCYYASPFNPPPNDYPPGNITEYLNFSPPKRRLLFTPITSSESVLVCGWPSLPNGDRPLPQIWRFFLFPKDRILCLNVEVTDELRQHQAMFHYFTLIHGSIYLLGSEDEEDELDAIDEDDKILDVCLELSIQSSSSPAR